MTAKPLPDIAPCKRCGGSGVEASESQGAEMRGARKLSGATITDVAGAMGISVTHLSDMERGNRRWTPEMSRRFMVAISDLEADR
jgi:predicted transcriptional regulator